jgi:hypothetical protein
MPKLSVFGLLAAGLAVLLFAALLAVARPVQALTPARTTATTRVPAPSTPAGLPTLIEPLAPYVAQTSCDPKQRPGTANLARLVAATYRSFSATHWSSTYSCGTDGPRSEHYDGRAIDWMVDVHNSEQHLAANAVVSWLLATDRAGHKFAMARRLGVMYVIYNNRMWGAWSGSWEPYNNCAKRPKHADDNACHRTHMHISLSWNGATGRTSYWTKHVSLTDYGPCRAKDLNWAYLYQRVNLSPCPQFAAVRSIKGASATKKALVTYSGASVRRGWKGPAVSTVQRALHVSATGTYNAGTVTAVKLFQQRHKGCPVTGAMNPPTWRALLAAVR